jgi:hypothetical protein
MRKLIILFILLMLSFSCSMKTQPEARPAIGPKTIMVEFESYKTVYYVSDNKGSDDTGDGSQENPWESIQHALTGITDAAPGHRYAVIVSAGDYSRATFAMKPHVDLYGGFESLSWKRDIFKYPTELEGDEKRRVILGADDARLDGFVIKEGRIMGKGAGLFCDGVSPTITNSIFIENQTLSPSSWNPRFTHEIANDGAAIYCENGSSPVIENNLFIENSTENGRGAGIALHGRCGGRIANNVFQGNVTGLNDPMRSSDGGAVSIFDWSNPVIENNVFIENRALANNDAGGMFVALWSSPVIKNNIFVGNECTDDAGALFVGGQEHRYDAPLDPLPSKEDFFVSVVGNLFIGNSNPSRNSGAMRFTMEGRGEFVNNITAHNTGIYFQRSEVIIRDNMILDNYRLVETKEGLNPCTVMNNTIWGKLDIQTEAIITGNRMREAYVGNTVEEPRLANDWISVNADAAIYNPSAFITELLVAGGGLQPDALAGRVVKSGDRWSVIKANSRRSIVLWGDFSGQTAFTIYPTYRL